jgi:hypothetical protein
MESNKSQDHYSSEDEEVEQLTKQLLFVELNSSVCVHDVGIQPQLYVSIESFKFCAVLDTGAELSLIGQSALDIIVKTRPTLVLCERLCDIVGFSGERTPIERVVYLGFAVGSYEMPRVFKFAVVSDEIMPHCFLLGLDFLTEHEISIDLSQNVCKHRDEVISRIYPVDLLQSFKASICMVQSVRDPNESHQLAMTLHGDDIRFEVKGQSSTIWNFFTV